MSSLTRAVAKIFDKQGFAITGAAGYYFWDVDANVSTGTVNISLSDDDTDFYAGIGIELIIGTDKISFRSEYTRYALDDDDADVISVRLVIPFQ